MILDSTHYVLYLEPTYYTFVYHYAMCTLFKACLLHLPLYYMHVFYLEPVHCTILFIIIIIIIIIVIVIIIIIIIITICDHPCEKVMQVSKINFKIWPPAALTANFVDFLLFFPLIGVLKAF